MSQKLQSIIRIERMATDSVVRLDRIEEVIAQVQCGLITDDEAIEILR